MVQHYTSPLSSDMFSYQDNELVMLLCNRDVKAFHLLYDKYAPLLNGIITQRTGISQTSNKLLENVFVWIWHNIHRFDHKKDRLVKWLINSTCKFLSENNIAHCTRDIAKPAFASNHMQSNNKISEVTDKHILELAYINNYSPEEISRELNIPVASVRTRLHAGLIILRKSLPAEM
jgi:RNA polymerase sigma-70 factor (ECF subfamily)